MLLVFALAITPKRFLHNIVANHTDTYSKLSSGKNELTKTGYNCQIDNLVATSPFTATDEKPEIKLPAVFILPEVEICTPNLFPAHIYFSLRGPPAFLSI